MDEWRAVHTNHVDLTKLKALKQAAGPGPVLILTHDNPDPDALASGKALATLLNTAWGLTARLCYSGLVARAENKAMLRVLTPEWEFNEMLTGLEQYSAIALVDTQPGAGNNRLTQLPQIVIDHHRPGREGLREVRFTDVRPEVGATVSLISQYLEAAGVVPDTQLATAIFYGIQADTRGLSRDASLVDQAVYFRLLSLIDHQALNEVAQAGLTRDYFRAFSSGLKAAQVYGRTIVTYLGVMHQPDFVAEMADLLIRLEDTHAALCLGVHRSTLYLSLRTAPLEQDAGVLIQKVIVLPGKAGGHGTMAGGQVPLGEQTVDALVARIIQRFLKVMGEINQPKPLLE